MTRPPAALVAQWYRRLGSSNIERPDGTLRAEQPGGRMLSLNGPPTPRGIGNQPGTIRSDEGQRWANDCSRKLASYHHDDLAAAYWRLPLASRHPGRGRPNTSVRKQRRVLRMLADGATTREIARKVRVSLTLVARLARAVREWKDPDDDD